MNTSMAPGPYEALLLLLVGAVAGCVNVLAGGGSLVTLPALIFLGLPPTVANGTARIGILVQNVTAVARYWRAGALDWRAALRLMSPVLLGGAAGAYVSTVVPEPSFKNILAGVMLAVAVLVVLDPWRRPSLGEGPKSWGEHGIGMDLLLTLAGFYGGFLQAGVGYLLLFVLIRVGGLDLVRANVLKVLLVLAYTPVALAVFVASDRVVWTYGCILALGQAVGGWLGAAAALKKGAPLIRTVLVVAVAVAALRLLGWY